MVDFLSLPRSTFHVVPVKFIRWLQVTINALQLSAGTMADSFCLWWSYFILLQIERSYYTPRFNLTSCHWFKVLFSDSGKGWFGDSMFPMTFIQIHWLFVRNLGKWWTSWRHWLIAWGCLRSPTLSDQPRILTWHQGSSKTWDKLSEWLASVSSTN